MKGKILVDFLEEVPQQEMKSNNSSWWILNMDATFRQTEARLGLQLETPTEEVIEHAIRLDFLASNNEVEYEALIVGLDPQSPYPQKRSS